MRTIKREQFFQTNCSTDQAAKILGVTRSRIRQLTSKGVIGFVEMSPRAVVLNHADVMRLKRERRLTGRHRGGMVLD